MSGANQVALAAGVFLFPAAHPLASSRSRVQSIRVCDRWAPDRAGFPAPDGTSTAHSVFNLQHTDSFDWENPRKHKNAANADGFCLLVFLKMALAHMRRTSRDGNGDLKSQTTSLVPNEGHALTKGA